MNYHLYTEPLIDLLSYYKMSQLEKRALQSNFYGILTYCMNANMNLKIARICKSFFTISTKENIK